MTIAGAVGLPLMSYRAAIFSEAEADPDKSGDPGFTTTGRRETRVLSAYNRSSLPFQGRNQVFDDLQSWLLGSESVSGQVLLGGGGRGKTRLAVELMDWVADQGWLAGSLARWLRPGR